MIASVHVDARITIPLAVMLAAAMVWYWRHLRRPSVPRGRRVWRRVSLALMLLSLPAFVRGLSYLDPTVDADKQPYVMAWSTALLLVVVTFLTACVDIVVSMRIHRDQYDREVAQAGQELREAVRRQRVGEDAAAGSGSSVQGRAVGPGKDGPS